MNKKLLIAALAGLLVFGVNPSIVFADEDETCTVSDEDGTCSKVSDEEDMPGEVDKVADTEEVDIDEVDKVAANEDEDMNDENDEDMSDTDSDDMSDTDTDEE